jgi:hypothetical protein
VGILEHRIRLSDAGSGADVDAEPGTLGSLNPGKHLLATRACELVHAFIVRGDTYRVFAIYELFMAVTADDFFIES